MYEVLFFRRRKNKISVTYRRLDNDSFWMNLCKKSSHFILFSCGLTKLIEFRKKNSWNRSWKQTPGFTDNTGLETKLCTLCCFLDLNYFLRIFLFLCTCSETGEGQFQLTSVGFAWAAKCQKLANPARNRFYFFLRFYVVFRAAVLYQ